MTEDFSETKKDNTPDWAYRWGLRFVSLALIAGGAAGIRNLHTENLTAAGVEAIPFVGAALIVTGILGLGASKLK
jgi:hypothetical protein